MQHEKWKLILKLDSETFWEFKSVEVKKESLTWVNLCFLCSSMHTKLVIVSMLRTILFHFMSRESSQVFVSMFSFSLLTCTFQCEWPNISGRQCKRAKCKREIWIRFFFICNSHPFHTRKSAMNASRKKIDVLNIHRHDSLRNCAINFKTLMHHN